MALRQSLHSDTQSKASVTNGSAAGKQSQRELYDFLPRTGMRSNQSAPVVESFTRPAVLLEADYAEPEDMYIPRIERPKRGLSKAEIRRRNRMMRNAVLSCALLGLVSVACYAGYLYHQSAAVKKYAGSILSGETVQAAFPGQTGINLVVIGRDYDYNNQDEVIKTHARSDMLMVARLDFAGKSAHLLSIPRDTAAMIPGHGVNKINAAHAFGGPVLTETTLAQNFGITPNNYVALDFSGFEKAIDILGGVDVNVDKKMDYDDNWGHLHIHLLPGFQHLSGEQAIGFVRFRHSDSDIIRTHRQQALLAALKMKLMQPQTLAKLPAMLDAIDSHIDSDLTAPQKVALVSFIHGLPDGGLQMLTMPTTVKGQVERTDYANAQPIFGTWFGATIPAKAVKLVDSHKHHAVKHVIVVTANPASMPINAKLTD